MNCVRCKGELNGERTPVKPPEMNSFDTGVRSPEPEIKSPKKVSLALKGLFFLMYVGGVVLSFFGVVLVLALGDKLGLMSITYVVTAGIVAFIIPLAGVHYFIENWKTSITKDPYPVAARYPELAESLAKIPEDDTPLVLRGLQAVIVLVVAAAAIAVSGQFFYEHLPPGRYPALLLGLPALIAGVITIGITNGLISLLRGKK